MASKGEILNGFTGNRIFKAASQRYYVGLLRLSVVVEVRFRRHTFARGPYSTESLSNEIHHRTVSNQMEVSSGNAFDLLWLAGSDCHRLSRRQCDHRALNRLPVPGLMQMDATQAQLEASLSMAATAVTR
jgi:hypothetical protein